MQYYVIPDLHGRADLARNALKMIYQCNPGGGVVIFLGDYIDRGPDQRGCIHIVRNPPRGWQFITLRGNHEQMAIDAFTSNGRIPFYDESFVKEYTDDPEAFNDDMAWMLTTRLTHQVGPNIFAHAWYDATLPPVAQNPDMVMWRRMGDSENWGGDALGMFLTHGHTPKGNGPVRAIGRINLDTGAVFTGSLAVATFEGIQPGPSEIQMVTA